MTMQAYLNGRFVEVEDAAVSAHDAGLQHAVGLFETMQAFGGKVFRLEAHIARLIGSARATGLTAALRQDPLCELVEATLARNAMAEARIRLTVTGGDLSLLAAARDARQDAPPKPHEPTVLCVVSPPTQYPPQFFDEGVSVIVADARANPFDSTAGHKTLNYWSRLRALADAAGAGAGEALWLSITNHLAGGSVSNVFLVRGGALLTPIARGEEAEATLPSAVLPGITRAAVIELAEAMDIDVKRRMLGIDDLLEADEVFATNSSWQVLPVVAVERRTIGDGKVGELTDRLRRALLDLVRQETG
jgi:branched-subunit amino acid aminotransferase/4-amino-4-deoxychorismate lyase